MIDKLNINDISQVAKIHKRELPGFLPELGEEFLKKFYMASLKIPEMFTFVSKENDQTSGFVTGVTTTKGLYKKIIFTDILGFILTISRYYITHLDKIFRIFKFFSYPGFNKSSPELLILVVSSKYHRKGIGKSLVRQVALEFKKRGIDKFKISTYDRLPANGFYKKIGCKFEYSFDYMGEKMNYYSFKTRISKS